MKKIVLLLVIAFIINFLFWIIYQYNFRNVETSNNEIPIQNININENITHNNIVDKTNEIVIEDWRITLVNYDNKLPENFEIKLANIDSTRQFDKRAINELLTMMKDAKKQGTTDMWVQSAYRSINYQQDLFDEKVNKYLTEGKTMEDAKTLTLQTINKPGTSEHNLGLAVDFNYVNYNFENTKAFKWLQEYADNYGFILRYRKDKEDITKVDYEPWHWRYVGSEHAKKMNELNMCLEEYVEYLKNN